jgi:hypothetical protein
MKEAECGIAVKNLSLMKYNAIRFLLPRQPFLRLRPESGDA